MIRVLVFLASRHRPILLRHMLMQMALQTYPVSVSVYLNAPATLCRGADYRFLLNDLHDGYEGADRELFVGFGPTHHPHENVMAALGQTLFDQYDLFLNLNDHRVYRLDHVAKTVRDFERKRWDVWEKSGNAKTDWGLSSPAIQAINKLAVDWQTSRDDMWRTALQQAGLVIRGPDTKGGSSAHKAIRGCSAGIGLEQTERASGT